MKCCLALVLAMTGITTMLGCESDSFVDPTVVGRWEPTPLVMPILDRLDVVEPEEEVIIGLSRVTSEDLIHDVQEYVIGPGDSIQVSVLDLYGRNAEATFGRRVDELGFIRLPQIGRVRVEGLTTEELQQQIIDILDPDILIDPQVTVMVGQGQRKTFKMIGGAEGDRGGTRSGVFALPRSDFRLLDAIAQSGGLDSRVATIYIIRHIPLDPIVVKGFRTSEEEVRPGDYLPPMRPSAREMPVDPDEADQMDPADLIRELTNDLEAEQSGSDSTDETPGTAQAPSAARPLSSTIDDEMGQPWYRYVYLNGEWVRVQRRANTPELIRELRSGKADSGADLEAKTEGGENLPAPGELWTQRVIEVDARALMQGAARWNLVIRPDDIIRVPSVSRVGNLYMGGSIARPGTFGLPAEGLTLKQAIISAGGFAPEGIPERVDLIRRIDGGRAEVTIRLNARAIFEGLQPDIYLQPDDTINVGTNFWAGHLAIFRNSFRQNYGWGFVLDRNFATDVFN